ncbi:MAG: SulP family inorganic anion transporter, partial [Gemmatimonadota bacterium]|nr:SulP family inorganic anion transporter [Gemmatimonadota bacterium]
PVIVGFTTAAALIILASQAGNLLGLDLGRSQYLHEVVLRAYRDIGEASGLSVGLGTACILALLAFRRWTELFPGELVVIAAATAVAWFFDLGDAGVRLVGDVPSGLPGLALPDLSLGAVGRLWATVIALALVQFMSAVSMGRVFSSRHRYTIDPNQELLAVGSANFLGSLFQSIPVSASFSRSAVNEQAGARTPLANVVTAAMIGLTLLFLTPAFRYLPLPALAALIIVAAASLIDVEEIRRLWRTKPSDGWVAAVTFGAVLAIGIVEGLLIGVAWAVLKILYRISHPYVAELGHLPSTRSFKNLERFAGAEPIPEILMLRVEAGFSFFNAKFFRDYVLAKSQQGREIRAVVIDGISINYLDSTAVETVEEVVGTLREWGIEIHFTGLTGPVRDVVERSGLGDFVGEGHFHISPHYAVIDILDRWDDEDDGERLERYWRSTQQKRERVEPTSESRFL